MCVFCSTYKNGDDCGVVYYCFTHIIIITGWWFQPTPLKNDGVR